ncbi:MAG: hypothetical protein EBU23_02145 [Mycobacteriaceae bacterium]|nr:hypothetical protein [Mycobacteriaceae bacterium]NBQ41396.1 hypothetical protein [Mycobacteriaceae bacterium]
MTSRCRGRSAAATATTRDAAQINCAALGEPQLQSGWHVEDATQPPRLRPTGQPGRPAGRRPWAPPTPGSAVSPRHRR